MTPRERFDPPLLRLLFVLDRALSRDAFMDALHEEGRRAGWAHDRVESALHHGGVQLGGRPHERAALPEVVPARTWIRVHAFMREPETPPLPEPLVLHDRDGIVAVAKPPWWPVQGTRASQRLSLERVLRQRLAAADLVPVHRLDRETSGLLVFARDAATARRLGHAFATRRVEKRYVAAVWPAPALTKFTVHGWIERARDPARFRFALTNAPGPGRRESETHFSVLTTHGGGALVDAVPMTGRTHQIRVHLATAGSPIVGDAVYGRVDAPTADRCLLHAASLRIRFDDGTHLALEAPWPEDLRKASTAGGNRRKHTVLDDGNPV